MPVPGVPIDDGFANGLSILEGPVWVSGEGLLLSHFAGEPSPTSRIYRVAPDGQVALLDADAGTNGLALSLGESTLLVGGADGLWRLMGLS